MRTALTFLAPPAVAIGIERQPLRSQDTAEYPRLFGRRHQQVTAAAVLAEFGEHDVTC